MNTQVIVELLKTMPDRFFVDDNNFILDKETGILILINPIDDQLVGAIPEEEIKSLQTEIEELIDNNDIEPEVLEKFNQRYCL